MEVHRNGEFHVSTVDFWNFLKSKGFWVCMFKQLEAQNIESRPSIEQWGTIPLNTEREVEYDIPSEKVSRLIGGPRFDFGRAKMVLRMNAEKGEITKSITTRQGSYTIKGTVTEKTGNSSLYLSMRSSDPGITVYAFAWGFVLEDIIEAIRVSLMERKPELKGATPGALRRPQATAHPLVVTDHPQQNPPRRRSSHYKRGQGHLTHTRMRRTRENADFCICALQ